MTSSLISLYADVHGAESMDDIDRIAPLKARDAENEQLVKKAWRTRMKVFTRRRVVPGVLFILCVVSLVFRMRQEKLKFISMDLGRSLEVSHKMKHSPLNTTTYQHTTQDFCTVALGILYAVMADILRGSSPYLDRRPSASLRNS